MLNRKKRRMGRNIELKAHCADLGTAHGIAQALGATLHSVERQHDTYFRVERGRLKLRQRWLYGREQPSELIWYERPDATYARASDYTLVQLDNGAALGSVLRNALGVVVEVAKQRTVYLYDNVRIHLDEVTGLGTFLEFEAIVDAACDDANAHAKLERLRVAFAIQPEHVVSVSYADLLRDR